MKFYLGVGVILQVPYQAGAEVAEVGLDIPDIVPEAVQLGDHDLVTVGTAVGLAAADDSPGYNDHEDADGSDNLNYRAEALRCHPSRSVMSAW